MTTATQPERQSVAKPLPAKLLRGLHAEWRKLSPGLQGSDQGQVTSGKQDAERGLRLNWTNQTLATRHLPLITSWSCLTTGQAKFLLKQMREESGDGPTYRALLMARLAARLWPGNWDALLADRLGVRYRTSRAADLSPAQAHEMIEELLSRVARAEGREIEELRREIMGKIRSPGLTGGQRSKGKGQK